MKIAIALIISCISILLISFILINWVLFELGFNKKDSVKKEIPKEVVSVSKVKIVFIVVGKNIDFNKMSIDDIVNQIKNDSFLEVKKASPEIYINPQIIKVYRVEDITCSYLKKRFSKNMAGEIVYEYNDKILVKLNDGIIKVYHGHVKN